VCTRATNMPSLTLVRVYNTRTGNATHFFAAWGVHSLVVTGEPSTIYPL